MPKLSTHTGTELAHRSSDGMDVTLVWVQEDRRDGEDRVVVASRSCTTSSVPVPQGNSPGLPTDGPARLVKSTVLRDRVEGTQTVRARHTSNCGPLGRESD
jgi:hypothetical protein